ncbi:hypothetical protein SH668x_001566 [Planctomicrobium sp. SH668]|uniref:hypothetical protein n=1 Tax=Planctomicrobium sp. SH668 TaxID=3448126 RepID=UPI003F5C570A
MLNQKWLVVVLFLLGTLFLETSQSFSMQPPVAPTPEVISEQEQPDDSNAVDEAIVPVDAEEGAHSSAGDDKVEPMRHRGLILVPFDELGKTLKSPQSDVILPYSEYRQLLDFWKKAHSGDETPVAVLTSADYVIRVEEGVARVAVNMTARTLGKGWSQLPIRFGDPTVGKFSSDQDVLVQGIDDGSIILHFPEAGNYEFSFELDVPVHQSPETRELKFETPPVALTTAKVTVPGKNLDITFNRNQFELPVDEEATDDVTTKYVSLQNGRELTVNWRVVDTKMPTMELLTSVNQRTLVTIADGLVHTETWLTYDVLRGEIKEVRIVLPRNLRLLDVFADSGNLGAWATQDSGENQIVTVTLPAATKTPPTIIVRTERPLGESDFSVIGMSADKVALGIHAMDAVRESGQIAVRHAGDLSVNVDEQKGLVRIEPSEADPKLAGTNAFLFKFYSQDVLLKLTAKPVQPRITVTSLIDVAVQEDELSFTNHFRYSIAQAGVFELLLKVPAGAVIDSVESPALKEFILDAAKTTLRVTLRERALGDVDLAIKGHVSTKATGDADSPLPLIEPLGVERELGQVFVLAKSSMEVQAVQSGIEAAQPIPLGVTLTRNDLPVVSAWSFTRRPVVIPIRATRKPTRLTATSGASIQIDPEIVHVSTIIGFNVEYSPLSEFRIDVPEAVSNLLQIELISDDHQSAPIKQKTAAPAVNGRVVWTIQTQREVVGLQRFQVNYDLPGNDSANKEREVALSMVRPLEGVNEAGEITTPLVSVQSEISVKKDKSLAMSAVSSGNGIEQIDVRELKLVPQDGTIAFRYFKDSDENPIGLTVKLSSFELQDVVATVVSRGLVEIVTSEDRSATYRSRFCVKSSERQRLLVGLPSELEVLGAFLNDREVRLEKADVSLPEGLHSGLAPFWVNVARPESSETAFQLSFQFLWKLQGASASLLEEGQLELPLPVISGGKQGVVQDLRVVIWMPKEFSLVGDPVPFLLQKKKRLLSVLRGQLADHQVSALEQWISEGCPNSGVQGTLPTEGRFPFVYSTLGESSQISVRVWNKLWMTILISSALVIIAMILIGTSWENKLGFVLLLAFAAALYGVKDPQGLSQIYSASRIGLVFMLLLWGLRGLLGARAPQRKNPPSSYTSTSIPYAVIPPPGVFDSFKPKSGDATS